MHTFLDGLNDQVAADEATQASRAPHALPIATAGIQANHEARRADARSERFDVERQVRATRLLAGLNQHDAACMRHLVRLQSFDSGQRSERCIAIICTSAPIQAFAAHHGSPRPQALFPTAELGLLVQVAIQQHRVCAGGSCSRDLHPDDGRATFQAHDLHRQSADRTRAAPVRDQLRCTVHVSMLTPLSIKGR